MDLVASHGTKVVITMEHTAKVQRHFYDWDKNFTVGFISILLLNTSSVVCAGIESICEAYLGRQTKGTMKV